MTGRSQKRGFVARPGDPEPWVRASEPQRLRNNDPEAFTARLTLDVTPELHRRIKIAAFQRGPTVADMLRDLFAHEFPKSNGEDQ